MQEGDEHMDVVETVSKYFENSANPNEVKDQDCGDDPAKPSAAATLTSEVCLNEKETSDTGDPAVTTTAVTPTSEASVNEEETSGTRDPAVTSTATTSTSEVSEKEKDSDSEKHRALQQSNTKEENSVDYVDDDQTQEYSLNKEERETTQSSVQYTDEDFLSEDDEDLKEADSPGVEEDSDMGMSGSKKSCLGHGDISDNSSDENMDKPLKAKSKKYKQTKLDFGAGVSSRGASASTSRSDSPSSSGGRVTRRSVTKKTGSDRGSFFKRMGDRDTEHYRLGYPGQKDDTKLNANLQFYKGQISSYPDGALVDEIHDHWWGNFELLEQHHGYIQWIFPIREEGMNWQAQALQLHEAKEIIADKEAHDRVLLSYEMMLDFYGMKLEDRRTGMISRSKHWQQCYRNLNFSSHNYLRITRILKSLGEFDLEHLKKPWLEFIMAEIFENGELRRTLNSLQNYWIGTLKNDNDREELHQYIEERT